MDSDARIRGIHAARSWLACGIAVARSGRDIVRALRWSAGVLARSPRVATV